VRRLRENINDLIDAFLAVAKTYVAADQWAEFCAALRRHAEATAAKGEEG
jgi:hypothetical protein